MTTTLTGPAPTVQRDRWGRPLIQPIQPLGAKKVGYTRATTIAKTLDDGEGLTKWKQRQTALGIAARPDLLAAVASTSTDDKTTLSRIVDQAMEAAGSSAAATTGTAIHAFTERHDRGLDLGHVPDDIAPDVQAYIDVMASSGLKVLEVEKFLVNHPNKIAGTTDRIVELDGKRYIADVKTSQSIDFHLAFAMQLSIYAHSQPYDLDTDTTGVWDQAPETNAGLIIHVPSHAGTASIHWIDLKAGWAAVQLALKVREWRKTKGILAPYIPPTNVPTQPA